MKHTQRRTSTYRSVIAVLLATALTGVAGSSPSGAVVGPVAQINPTSVNFGDAAVGWMDQLSITEVTVTNVGDQTLTISAVSIRGAHQGDFRIMTNGCTGQLLQPGTGRCTVAVGFAPTTVGSRSAELAIDNNAPNSPRTVALAGYGAVPVASFEPPDVSFGDQIVGMSSASRAVAVQTSVAPACSSGWCG